MAKIPWNIHLIQKHRDLQFPQVTAKQQKECACTDFVIAYFYMCSLQLRPCFVYLNRNPSSAVLGIQIWSKVKKEAYLSCNLKLFSWLKLFSKGQNIDNLTPQGKLNNK